MGDSAARMACVRASVSCPWPAMLLRIVCLRVGQLAEVGDPVLDPADDLLVQPAGPLLAVAGDERDRVLLVEQLHDGLDLDLADLQVLGDARQVVRLRRGRHQWHRLGWQSGKCQCPLVFALSRTLGQRRRNVRSSGNRGRRRLGWRRCFRLRGGGGCVVRRIGLRVGRAHGTASLWDYAGRLRHRPESGRSGGRVGSFHRPASAKQAIE